MKSSFETLDIWSKARELIKKLSKGMPKEDI